MCESDEHLSEIQVLRHCAFSKCHLCRDTGPSTTVKLSNNAILSAPPHETERWWELFFLHPLTDPMVVKNIQES